MGTPCLSRPKGPSLSSPAGVLLLLDSWPSPHNPALPSLASPISNVGRAESVCCPRRVAKFRDDHESAQTRPCDKFCGRHDWVFSQHLWASHKELPNTTNPHTFFILYVFLERNRRRGSPMSLSLPLVSLVLPNRGQEWDGLCSTCSHRLKTSSNPVNSKCAWKI